MRYLLILACLLLAGWQLVEAGYIWLKADLAQHLIASAWEQTLKQQQRVKPWQWADTWPVAQLSFPWRQQEFYVLAGTTGNALAFGPGHQSGTALPGEGSSLLAGHRDTHFQLLQQLELGEPLQIQTAQGVWYNYQVDSLEVVDSREQDLQLAVDEEQLVLVTCYPFDALQAGGPLRYVVIARPEGSRHGQDGQI